MSDADIVGADIVATPAPLPFILWLAMEEKDGLCLGCELGAHIHVSPLLQAATEVRALQERLAPSSAPRVQAVLVLLERLAAEVRSLAGHVDG